MKTYFTNFIIVSFIFIFLYLILLPELSISCVWSTLNCTILYGKSFTNKVDDDWSLMKLPLSIELQTATYNIKGKNMFISHRHGCGLKYTAPEVCYKWRLLQSAA